MPNLPNVCIDKHVQPSIAATVAVMINDENIPSVEPGTWLGNTVRDARESAFILTGKKWRNGQDLRIAFLEGDAYVIDKIKDVCKQWLDYANLNFDFVPDPRDATIRVSQDKSDGSWSYIATDACTIPVDQPTMNYGWLERDTADEEYHRVVLHEFGHMLGMPHEHQHPHAGIPWDKEKVYTDLGGPPNNWSREEIDNNMFDAYAESNTSFSDFDKHSIMLYSIPNKWTVGDYQVGWNHELSDSDKKFIAAQYPKSPPPTDPPVKLPTITITRLSLRGVKERSMVTKSGRDFVIAEPLK